MGLRERVLAVESEIAPPKRVEASAGVDWEAARKREQREQREYLRGLIRPHLARWCTEMGIDSPTPEFTVVEAKEYPNRPLVVTFRFSVDDLSFDGDYRKYAGAHGDEMKIYLPQHRRYAGYEINNLAGLVRMRGRPAPPFLGSMK